MTASASPFTAALPPRRWIADLSAVVLLLAIPVIGFQPTFDSASYLVAAVGALAIGVALGALGTLLRWGVLLLSGATVVAYFFFGGALALSHTTVAGVIPTLETLRLLALGAIESWKKLLTTVAPVAPADGHLIVPLLLALVAGVLTASLALRARHAAWALLPAAAFLAVEIALGTSQPFVPVVQGVAFGLIAVVWLAIRQAWLPQVAAVAVGDRSSSTRSALMRRALLGAAVIAVAAVAGVATSAFAAPSSPRYVLRDVVIPPFDIREFPSPLQSFRAFVRDYPDETLFTVTGLPEGARVHLATMDAYNGTVYNVSDEGAGSSSAFSPVRTNMSADVEGTPATLRVEVGAFEDVWMPDAGAARSITFDGDRADDLRRTAFYNESTSTGVVTAGLREGDAYTVESVIPDVPSDEALADTPFARLSLPDQEGVPQDIAEVASTAVADATTPIEQVRALQTMLSEGGYFSHGLEGQPLSRAGHGAERITTLLGSDQMVGDDEQYATAMALLAREVGIPARVVMGFYPDEDAQGPVFEANGESLHAWVEVAFEGHGWVPFDPTPPEDQVPSDQTTKPKADPKPQVLQPPPPPQEPVDLPPTTTDERGSDDEEGFDAALIWMIVAIGFGSIGILFVLLAPFVVIGALKAARRRQRRSAERASDRISGGWDELVDRAADHGAPVRPGGTRREDAGILSAALAEPRVATLASRADTEVFGPTEPSAVDVEEFWTHVDEIVGGMGRDRSWWHRLGARLSIRSLLVGTRFALPPRAPRPPVERTKPRRSSNRSEPERSAPAPLETE